MFAPEAENTLPSPSATPRMLVAVWLEPTLAFQMVAPVLPSMATTFCWVVWT